MFTLLTDISQNLLNVSFEVLRYVLTSTYFESDPPLDENDKRRHGYSGGVPLAYEVLPGNTSKLKPAVATDNQRCTPASANLL